MGRFSRITRKDGWVGLVGLLEKMDGSFSRITGKDGWVGLAGLLEKMDGSV